MGGLDYRLNSIPNNLKIFFSGTTEFVHVEVRPREGMFTGRIGDIKAARALVNYKSLLW